MDKTPSPKIQSNLMRLCAALLISVSWLSGCGAVKFEPAEIAADDVCSFCKMAISERQYAAQFINRDGDVFKFDDIGCLTSHLKTKQSRGDIAAIFVLDYDARQWVKAEQSYFVKSEEFNTPMSGGIVAFSVRAKAEEAAAKYHGKMLGFGEVFSETNK
jgi:copper chaperone NosL